MNNEENKRNSNIPRKGNNKNNYSEDSDNYDENEYEILSNLDNQDQNEADWWRTKMQRREATKKVIGVSIGAALVAYVALRGCDDDGVFGDIDDDETESNVDAMDLQKKEGWNAGHTDKNLTYADAHDFNSLGSTDYQKYTTLDELLACWKPKNEAFLPFFVPTLMQVTTNDNFRNVLKPVCSKEMKDEYSKGLGFKELISQSKDFKKTMIVADLSGTESVAFAAALSDKCVPVVTFDNWPHPLGIVPSHLTLGAMVYYAEEVKNNAAKLDEDSPLLMVLDRKRFKTYINPESDFDNRYMAKIPTSENLKKLGIESILYVVDKETQELDDLNDDFAYFKDNGITVSMLDLDNFKPEGSNADSLGTPLISKTPTQQAAPQSGVNPNSPNYYHSSAAPVYYYGGHSTFMPFFFMNYGFISPMRTYRSYGTMPSTIRTSSYTPAKRATIFSSRSVGGTGGIGRTRPTGFGSISTRMNRSTGRMTGIRTGKTGSFGRVSSFGRSS